MPHQNKVAESQERFHGCIRHRVGRPRIQHLASCLLGFCDVSSSLAASALHSLHCAAFPSSPYEGCAAAQPAFLMTQFLIRQGGVSEVQTGPASPTLRKNANEEIKDANKEMRGD
jgi:hypothetical protein